MHPGQSARARQQPASTSGRQHGGSSSSFYAETPEGTRFTAGSFADLNLSRPLLRAVSALGYTQPTPIQVRHSSSSSSSRGCCMLCQL
jgi:ATP-dependent RNA helicase DDX27